MCVHALSHTHTYVHRHTLKHTHTQKHRNCLRNMISMSIISVKLYLISEVEVIFISLESPQEQDAIRILARHKINLDLFTSLKTQEEFFGVCHVAVS